MQKGSFAGAAGPKPLRQLGVREPFCPPAPLLQKAGGGRFRRPSRRRGPGAHAPDKKPPPPAANSLIGTMVGGIGLEPTTFCMSRHASWGICSTVHPITCGTATCYTIDWSNQLDGCGQKSGHKLASGIASSKPFEPFVSPLPTRQTDRFDTSACTSAGTSVSCLASGHRMTGGWSINLWSSVKFTDVSQRNSRPSAQRSLRDMQSARGHGSRY